MFYLNTHIPEGLKKKKETTVDAFSSSVVISSPSKNSNLSEFTIMLTSSKGCCRRNTLSNLLSNFLINLSYRANSIFFLTIPELDSG